MGRTHTIPTLALQESRVEYRTITRTSTTTSAVDPQEESRKRRVQPLCGDGPSLSGLPSRIAIGQGDGREQDGSVWLLESRYRSGDRKVPTVVCKLPSERTRVGVVAGSWRRASDERTATSEDDAQVQTDPGMSALFGDRPRLSSIPSRRVEANGCRRDDREQLS